MRYGRVHRLVRIIANIPAKLLDSKSLTLDFSRKQIWPVYLCDPTGTPSGTWKLGAKSGDKAELSLQDHMVAVNEVVKWRSRLYGKGQDARGCIVIWRSAGS
jgi:hypothetical protein